MDDTNFSRRSISLPRGAVLEVDITTEFLEVVRKHFDLLSASNVTDDHIRMYIWGSFKNAIDKAEREGQLQ
jgi:hypothetical protein